MTKHITFSKRFVLLMLARDGQKFLDGAFGGKVTAQELKDYPYEYFTQKGCKGRKGECICKNLKSN